MRDTSSRTTSHTEFEYNVALQANDHTQNKLITKRQYTLTLQNIIGDVLQC